MNKTAIFVPSTGKGSYREDRIKVKARDIYLLESEASTTTSPNIDVNGTGIISGDEVVWSTGYVFNIPEYVYDIRGNRFTAEATSKTLDAAHATLNRIDTIVATFDGNGDGFFDILKGVNNANPIKRTINYENQIEITTINVNFNTTEPDDVSTLLVYDENVEFTTADNTSGGVNFDATANPYNGTKHIAVTGFEDGDEMSFTTGSPFNPLSYDLIQLPIAPTTVWASSETIKVQLFSGTTPVSTPVNIDGNKDGSYFMDSTSTDYQVVAIPMTAFNITTNSVDKIVISKGISIGGVGFSLDLIRFQNGIIVPLSTSKTKLSEFTNDGNGDINYPFITTKVLRKEITASYILLPEDNGYTLISTSATPINITVNSGLGFFECDFYIKGAGLVTFVQGTATLVADDGFTVATKKICGLFMELVEDILILKGEVS